VATWEDACRIALALPDTEESTSYRQPCVKVRGKTFVWMSPHEEGALATRVPYEEALLLIEARPDVYFTTPHYEGYDAVLARPEAIDEEELAGRIEDAWEFVRATRSARKTRAAPPDTPTRRGGVRRGTR
jgi:hypothetical protein